MRTFDTTPIQSHPLDEWRSIHKTKWVVITGASCSGKSTVIEKLSSLGYACINEVARAHFDEQIAEGIESQTIRSNEGQFQLEVMNKKLEVEAKLNPDDLVFLDRGMPDSITYYRRAGINPNSVASECMRFRYRLVFIFHQLPHVMDKIRNESKEENRLIQKWLKRDYESMGYTVVDVPVLPIKDRVDLVLTEIKESENA